jgi:CRP/FNR family transcriptional regulator
MQRRPASLELPSVPLTHGAKGKPAFAIGAFPPLLVPGQKYPAGVELLKQGEMAGDVWIIDDGVVKLTYVDVDGRDFIVGVRLKGWILGSASVILEKPSPVAAFTMTHCHLQRLDAEMFLEMLSGNSTLSSWLHRMNSQEVFDQLVSITQASALSSRQRLEQLLAQLVQPSENNTQGIDVRVTLPFSHRDLAGLLSITPEHLSRLLRQLTDEGLIRRAKGWIVVTDLRKLVPAHSLDRCRPSQVDIYQQRR